MAPNLSAEMLEQNFPGYWGQATATIDWCEANYEVTYYIAEFWNTVTNVSMIVLPIMGAWMAWRDQLEKRFIFCHLMLLLIGLGSTCFHGTLLYELQLLDELPMIWGSSFLIYSLIEADSPPKSHNYVLQWGLVIYCAIVTVVYLTIKQPLFHEAAYGIMVFTMIFSSVRIVRLMDHSMLLFLGSFGIYAIGFTVWNIDHIFCSKLRYHRSRIPASLRPALQLHGWWHLLAGIGTYLGVLFATHARGLYLKKAAIIKMDFILPTVRVKNSE